MVYLRDRKYTLTCVYVHILHTHINKVRVGGVWSKESGLDQDSFLERGALSWIWHKGETQISKEREFFWTIFGFFHLLLSPYVSIFGG
jgi:hypothetical protein